jgi:hypothetical protein
MTGQTFKTPYLKRMHERLMISCERVESLVGNLNAEQLNWKPGENQWSIAQCLEHTLFGADLYFEKLEPAIRGAHSKRLGIPNDFQPRPTFAGRLILSAVEPSAKRALRSPKIFAPAPTNISDDVGFRFKNIHEKVANLTLDGDGLDLNRIKLSSPVARLIRINAADAFSILVTHAERHINQAERVRQSAGFPE